MKEVMLNALQKQAVEASLSSGFFMITGGAGTGKTTVIRKIVEGYLEKGEEPYVCALAGKAAARAREANNVSASTIHSLLQYAGESGAFMAQESMFANSAVIVDEASMVPSTLLAEICKRKPKRLILVGDSAQLPPVGAGQPFQDMLQLYPEKSVELKHSYRASGAIYEASQAVRQGRIPVDSCSGGEAFAFVNASDDKQAENWIVENCIMSGYEPSRDLVVVPHNEGEVASVESLNTRIACTRLPTIRALAEEGKLNQRTWLQPGVRVINTKNLPSLDIWNGTTGTLQSVQEDGKRCHIYLDSPVRSTDGEETQDIELDEEQSKNLKPAYALSVHKSQGSEYRDVYVMVSSRDSLMLSRQLLYTAISRAKRRCTVIGSRSIFEYGIRIQKPRHTVFQTGALA